MIHQLGLLSCLVWASAVYGHHHTHEPQPVESHPGKCPEIQPAENFDINKWASGVWYQTHVEEGAFWFENITCLEKRPHYEDKSNIVVIEEYYVNDSKPVIHNLTKDLVPGSNGRFRYPQSVQDEHHHFWWYLADSVVVLTDNSKYFVYWACHNTDNNTHYEYGYIYNHQRLPLPDETYQTVTTFFKEREAHVTFRPLTNIGCPVREQSA